MRHTNSLRFPATASRLFASALMLCLFFACREDPRKVADALFDATAYEEAALSYKPLAEKQPSDTALHRRYALSLARSGQAVEAEPVLTRLLKTHPDGELAAALVDSVAYARGPAAAEPILTRELERFPNHVHLLRAGGTLAAQQRDVQKALTLLNQALELDPHLASAHASLGDLALVQGNFSTAREHYRQGIALEPRSPMSIRLRVRVAQLVAEQSPGEAATILQEAASLAPQNPEVAGELGKVMASIGIYDSAIEFLKQAVDLKLEHPEYLSTLGYCYLQRAMERPDAAGRRSDGLAARMWLERLLKVAPTYRGAHINLGMVHQLQTDYEQAEAEFRQELTLYPNSPQALANLGRLYVQQGRGDEAQKLLERAFETDRRQVIVASELGALFMQTGAYAQALSWFQQAYALCQNAEFDHPCRVDTPYQLARLAARARDTDAAALLFLEAVGAGFRDIHRFRAEPEFAILQNDPRIASFLARDR